MVQAKYLCSLAKAELGLEHEIHSVDTGCGRNDRRLRELGLLEGRRVCVLAKQGQLICRVGRCRLGLCKGLASGVLVAPVPPIACEPSGQE